MLSNRESTKHELIPLSVITAHPRYRVHLCPVERAVYGHIMRDNVIKSAYKEASGRLHKES